MLLQSINNRKASKKIFMLLSHCPSSTINQNLLADFFLSPVVVSAEVAHTLRWGTMCFVIHSDRITIMLLILCFFPSIRLLVHSSPTKQIVFSQLHVTNQIRIASTWIIYLICAEISWNACIICLSFVEISSQFSFDFHPQLTFLRPFLWRRLRSIKVCGVQKLLSPQIAKNLI